uniref:glycosyltransferase n=1 Tax=Algoriphagus sp. TaxID=1872435 RepID=UPI004048A26A
MKKRICFVVSSAITVKAFLKNHIFILSKEYDIYMVGNFNDLEIGELRLFNLKEVQPVKIFRKITLFYDLIALVNLFSLFKKYNFDAVHSFTPKAGLLSMLASYFAKIPVRIHIFTGQVWATEVGLRKFFLKFFDGLIVFFATHILVDSTGQLNFLVQENIIKYGKATVLGKGSISGVDTNLFKSSIENKIKFKAELGLTESDIIILFLGRINRDKGILDLVKSFKILNKEFKNTHLLVVGFDEENLIVTLKDEMEYDNFVYVGPVLDPIQYYQVADIFCLPSYREGFGTSIIEASSCQLPIVCSDIYGLSDSIINGRTGEKHLVGDYLSLYEALRKFVENKELRDQIGLNGRIFVDSNFNMQLVSNSWEAFYAKILR